MLTTFAYFFLFVNCRVPQDGNVMRLEWQDPTLEKDYSMMPFLPYLSMDSQKATTELPGIGLLFYTPMAEGIEDEKHLK